MEDEEIKKLKPDVFTQAPNQIRMDWGERGAQEAGDRGDIVVIVDVFSFSSTITKATNFGAIVYPFSGTGDINELGRVTGAEVCLSRKEAKLAGTPSLSISSFTEASKGKKYVLYSSNGAKCTRAAINSKYVLLGSFLNATAVARLAKILQVETDKSITIIACGEKWSPKEGEIQLRPCVEDYWASGAILELLDGTKSPEAKACNFSYLGARRELDSLLLDSASGRELKVMGFPLDIIAASQFDLLSEVPILTEDSMGNFYFRNY